MFRAINPLLQTLSHLAYQGDMNDPTEEWMDYHMPGIRLSAEHRIQANSVIMMYKRIHLPRREYREWLTNTIERSFDCKVEGLRVSNKTGIEQGLQPYLFSYVILCTSNPIRTRNIKIFKWNSVQPEIRTLKNSGSVNAAVEYLDNWKYVSSIIPRRRFKIVEVPKLEDVVVPVAYPPAEIMYTSDRPPAFHVSKLIGWQLEAYNMIAMHCAPGYSFNPLPAGVVSYRDDSRRLERLDKAKELRFAASKKEMSSWDYKDMLRRSAHWLEEHLEEELRIVDEEYAKTALPEYRELRDDGGKTNREVQYVNCGINSGLTTFLQAIKCPNVMSDDAKKRADAFQKDFLARKEAGVEVGPDIHGPIASRSRQERELSNQAIERQFRKDIESEMRGHDPNRFLVIVGMPHKIAFLQAADEQRAKGWTGECVIFDLSKADNIPEIAYATIEAALDEHSCCSVWVFTRHLPAPKHMDRNIWKFYKKLIPADRLTMHISKLEAIETSLVNAQVNGKLPYGQVPCW